MRLKSVALRDSLAGLLPTLTAESGGDGAAVAHELHSNPVGAAPPLAPARVGSQAAWLPHRSFKTFPITSFWRYLRERNLSSGGHRGTRTAEIVQDSCSR